MKKIITVILAVVLALSLVAVVACNTAKTVKVRLYISDGGRTLVRTHEVGQNDLPTDVTNGNLVFGGWYYDKACNDPFTADDDKTENGTVLYAKWNTSSSGEKVTVVLSYGYDSKIETLELAKGATYYPPTPVHPNGQTFGGWYTQPTGGTAWTNGPVNETITLYAHWSNGGTTTDISSVLSKYSDSSKWNFADTVTAVYSGTTYSYYYEYLGDLVLSRNEDYSGNTYDEYYDMSDAKVWYYITLNEAGTYVKYDDTTDEYDEAYSYTTIIDLTQLSNCTLTSGSGYYSVQNPDDAGNNIFGDYGDDYTWTSINVYVSNDNITKIVAKLSDGTVYTHTFSKFGTVNFELPDTSVATITIDSSKSTFIEVGATIDYTQYFTVTDKDGENVTVTNSLLDLTNADTSKEGMFTVSITYEGVSARVTFTVVAVGTDLATTPAELTEVFAKYSNVESWNFALTLSGETDDYYEFNGHSILNSYEAQDGNTYTDYLGYDGNVYYLFYDNGDGTYTKYAEGSDEYEECYSYLSLALLNNLNNYVFVKVGSAYAAVNPNSAGNAVLGESDYAWTSLTVYVADGNIDKIIGVLDGQYEFTYTFSKHGDIDFELPNADEGGSGGEDDNPVVTPDGVMESQNYNANTFDKEVLQDKLTTVGEKPEPYIGLPSTGTYTALVVPIKFSNTTISSEQLNNLNIAFNGTSEQTGWESVKTYYQKASYGNLDLSFDIAGYNISGVSYYTANHNYSYYEGLYTTYQGERYANGDNVLLHEVLAFYKDKLDLTKYDHNNDGAIDAIYLIYSAPVDYSDDSFYWAYVTWDSQNTTKYDGKEAYYYLFAGLDFMKESVKGGYVNKNYPEISGLKINAATYIHETGHLLGLDDYYDYYPNGTELDDGTVFRGSSDEGLGGADMMDYTVGDQNVYSKIMLGWLTPEIVTSSKTITIKSSQEEGCAILIPLKFDNSYFCEYLLIDLYSAQGLNELHANMDGSYLYDGAAYGVRIYHVTSWINDPYNNDYESFTDYNNSTTDIALIKLVEADGEKKFASSDGFATEDDLWQTGDSFNTVFPNYTRNDGKTLNFNITIGSVSATEATITITYNS